MRRKRLAITNMKQALPLLLFSVIFSQDMVSQVLFAWCPEEQISSPRNGFLEDEKLDLFIYDARTSTEKTLVNCDGGIIRKNLIRLIKETYTSADIHVITGENSSVEPHVDRVTIKIGIAAYQVGPGTIVDHQTRDNKESSMTHASKEENWKAVVNYSLEVTDLSRIKSKVTKAIGKTMIRPGTEDHAAAKDLLSATYREANRELIISIDDAFIYEGDN